MIKPLCVKAGLSKPYTNSCVHTTNYINNMKRSGVVDRSICAVSGNCNGQSLSAYDRPTTKDAPTMAAAVDLVPVPAVSNTTMPSHSVVQAQNTSCSSTSSSSTYSATPYLNAAGSSFENASFVCACNLYHEHAENLKCKHSAA